MNVKNLLFNSGYTVADNELLVHDEKGNIFEFLNKNNFTIETSKGFIDENKAKHIIFKNTSYSGIIEVIQNENEKGCSYMLKS